jgi:hypothetical protein
MSKNTLDMSPVVAILAEALATAQRLDGAVWDDGDGKPSSDKAELSRTINHLADSLLLASGVVRNEYWVGKGFNVLTFVTDKE